MPHSIPILFYPTFSLWFCSLLLSMLVMTYCIDSITQQWAMNYNLINTDLE